MNNYSLGGFDPSLVEQIYNYVQPSPFATSAMRDPSLVGQTSEMLTRLSYPNDKLAPPTYSDVSMPTGQPEHDAFDVIGAILKAPFRLIGAAKNGLEEAIGHPNADRRAMQDEFVRQRELAILASNAVSQQEKQMLFPDAYAQDRQAIAAAQTGGDARATGRNTGDYPLPQPRKIGMSEWFFGDEQKQRNEQLARIKAFEALIAQKQEEAQAKFKQAELRGKEIANEKGQWDLTLGYAYDDTDRQLGQEVQRANINQSKASTASLYNGIATSNSANSRAEAAARRQEEEHNWNMLQHYSWDDLGHQAEIEKAKSDAANQKFNRQMAIEKNGADMTERAEAASRAERELALKERDQTFKESGRGKESSPTEVMNADTSRRNLFTTTYNAVFDNTKDADQANKIAAAVSGATLTKLNDGWFSDTTVPTFPDITPSQPAPARTSTGPDSDAEYNRVYLLLKPTWSGSEGALSSRARELSRISPSLDRSSDQAFARSAQAAGLSKEEARALWRGRR